MDIVRKRGDRIDTEKLSRNLGCQVLEISALKGTGIRELIEMCIRDSHQARNKIRHSNH